MRERRRTGTSAAILRTCATDGAFDALSSGQPLAVGRLQPNDFGLFDMLGNAAEWCHDCYRADPDSEAAANRDQNAAVMERDERVVRGGAFSDTAERLRSCRARQGPAPRAPRHDRFPHRPGLSVGWAKIAKRATAHHFSCRLSVVSCRLSVVST